MPLQYLKLLDGRLTRVQGFHNVLFTSTVYLV